MTIFFVLNGAGIVFLLYVLANFWKEGRRRKKIGMRFSSKAGKRDCADTHIVALPISNKAQARLVIIPFRTRGRFIDGPAQGTISGATSEARVRRISTMYMALRDYDTPQGMKEGRRC
jgi:hypothetical protein